MMFIRFHVYSDSSTEFLPKVHLLRGQAQCGQIGNDGISDYENLGHTYEAFALKQMKFFDESIQIS